MSLTEFSVRIGVALALGIFIGLERQWHNRTAGLRTNALVSLGAAIFASLALLITSESSPTRMAAQIVSGIGFLGAGLILREGNHVRGLNTAATLWCSAAIGTLCGSGFLKEASVGSLCVVVAHLVLRPISIKLASISRRDSEPQETTYRLKILCRSQDEQQVRSLLLQSALSADWTVRSLHSQAVSSNDLEKGVDLSAEIIMSLRQDSQIERLVSQLGVESGVTAISWQIVGLSMQVD
jgi:putative Mg2+ transporter-C (MgtC) family protein